MAEAHCPPDHKLIKCHRHWRAAGNLRQSSVQRMVLQLRSWAYCCQRRIVFCAFTMRFLAVVFTVAPAPFSLPIDKPLWWYRARWHARYGIENNAALNMFWIGLAFVEKTEACSSPFSRYRMNSRWHIKQRRISSVWWRDYRVKGRWNHRHRLKMLT